LTQALIAPMISQKWGRIINLSSVWGQTGASCEVLYSATKAAMIGFTKALAKEVAPSGITVNAIAPGVVDTDMMKSFSTEEKEELKKEIPTGSFTSPWEIAKIAKLLCEDGLSSFTGQVLGVNGGMYL